MFKRYALSAIISVFFIFFSFCANAGRLNFMLVNQTPVEITDVRIYPTYFPEYCSNNLLNTTLEPSTKIYIGPDFYSDQKLWSIRVTWSNGYTRSFDYLRLTRYNTYITWLDQMGYEHMKQTYIKEFARPSTQYANVHSDNISINVGVPEKVNASDNLSNYNKNNTKEIAMNTNKKKSATRDLVFEDDESEDENVTSVKATVELTRNGSTSNVLPSDKFQSGDKVKLVFTTNHDGHIYWLAKGTSGNYQVLYPSPKAGMDNTIKANTEYKFPTKGSWKFDDNKGTETVLCVIAKNNISDLDKAVELTQNNNASAASGIVKQIVNGHEKKRTSGTRDLVFDEEDDETVNTKTQTTNGEEPFVAVYELYHG